MMNELSLTDSKNALDIAIAAIDDNFTKAAELSRTSEHAKQFLITTVSQDGVEKVVGVRKKMLSEYLIAENHILMGKDIFYRYEDGVYETDDGSFIFTLVESVLGEYATSHVKNEIRSHIRDTKRIRLDVDELTIENEYLIGFNNGVYNWKTKTFTSHSPDYFLRSKLKAKYDPSAVSIDAIQMLKNIFGNDVDDELEYIGYSLTNTNWLDKISFYVGDGKNGRTFYFKWLGGLFGAKNCCNTDPHELSADKFAGVDLVDKQACLVADIGGEKINGFHRMKQYSTVDMVRVQNKGEKAFFARLFAKFFYGCNKFPYITDKSYGSTRRQRIIILKRLFSVNDDDYDPKILSRAMSDNEYSGLINLALEALDRLSERGDFRIRENNANFSHDLSRPLYALVDDCFEITGIKDDKILTGEVADINAKWCKLMDFPIPDRDSFISDFASKFAKLGVVKKQTTHKKKRGTYFVGIVKTESIDKIIEERSGV